MNYVNCNLCPRQCGADRAAGEDFILWCAEFAKVNNMNITVTVSDDAALASDAVKAYL